MLHSASKGGLVRLSELLLEKKLDVNEKDRYGMTPLHYAAQNDQRELVDFLIAKGADINIKNPTGLRPVNFAEDYGNKNIVELLINHGAKQGPPEFPVLKGDYLGQKKPGDTPEIFALGIISTHLFEHTHPAFSPDGSELFWSTDCKKLSWTQEIRYMKIKNGRWTIPETSFFSGEFGDCYPTFSANGKKLFFNSYRPLEPDQKSNQGRIWFIEKINNKWSNPESLEYPFNSITISSQIYATKDGTLYFHYSDENSKGGLDIYYSKLSNGIYSKPENIGEPINTSGSEFTPYIDPDEGYIIFSRDSDPENIGSYDLYISYRLKNGSWSKPVNLGYKINSEYMEWIPGITPDGKYLFFSSNRNGNIGDVYWVSTKFIDDLKPEK